LREHAALISCLAPNNQSICQSDAALAAIEFLNGTDGGYLASSEAATALFVPNSPSLDLPLIAFES